MWRSIALVLFGVVFAVALLACGGGGFSFGSGTKDGGAFPLPPTTPTTPGTSCAVIVSGRVFDVGSTADLNSRVLISAEEGRPGVVGVRYLPVATVAITPTTQNFGICLFNKPDPAYGMLIVVSAGDGRGSIYGPVVWKVDTTTVPTQMTIPDISLGGATLIPHTPPAPATINLNVTTNLGGVAGSVWTTTVASDPDLPSRILEFAVPVITDPLLLREGSITFQTDASKLCDGQPCSTLSIKVSSERPFFKTWNGYIQQAGSPAYNLIVRTNGSVCSGAWLETAQQQDGRALTAEPGASLAAKTVSFTNCKAGF